MTFLSPFIYPTGMETTLDRLRMCSGRVFLRRDGEG
jgi:hypothetical protein